MAAKRHDATGASIGMTVTVIPSASNPLSRRSILTAAGACLAAAVVPSIVTATTIPPEVTAFGPDAVRLWESGTPAVRRMVEWIMVASDRELDVIAAEMERQLAVLRAPIPNSQNTKGPVKGLAQSTGPSRSHRA